MLSGAGTLEEPFLSYMTTLLIPWLKSLRVITMTRPEEQAIDSKELHRRLSLLADDEKSYIVLELDDISERLGCSLDELELVMVETLTPSPVEVRENLFLDLRWSGLNAQEIAEVSGMPVSLIHELAAHFGVDIANAPEEETAPADIYESQSPGDTLPATFANSRRQGQSRWIMQRRFQRMASSTPMR